MDSCPAGQHFKSGGKYVFPMFYPFPRIFEMKCLSAHQSKYMGQQKLKKSAVKKIHPAGRCLKARGEFFVEKKKHGNFVYFLLRMRCRPWSFFQGRPPGLFGEKNSYIMAEESANLFTNNYNSLYNVMKGFQSLTASQFSD